MSLMWKVSSQKFEDCPNCGTLLRNKDGHDYYEVIICPPCRAEYKAEEARCAALLPTEENIREIVNNRVELSSAKRIYEHFYELWMDDMPYGTMKARDGDPHEWVYERLCDTYEHLIESEDEVA